MITVPQAFLENSSATIILRDGLNCVIEKKAHAPNPNNDRYVATHALTFVHSGSLSIMNNEGHSEIINDGQIVFLPKGLYMVSDIIPKRNSFRATVYFFDEKLIREFIHSYPNLNNRKEKFEGFWVTRQTDHIKSFNAYLDENYGDRNPKNNRLTRNKLQELLHIIASSDDGSSFLNLLHHLSTRDKIDIKRFMEQNFDKPLNVEDYANLTGRSPATFYRDFKRLYSSSPQQWLINMRLEKAKAHLLSDHERTITETAYEVGYENISHFIKAFKKRYGLSPKQFQMKSRESISF